MIKDKSMGWFDIYVNGGIIVFALFIIMFTPGMIYREQFQGILGYPLFAVAIFSIIYFIWPAINLILSIITLIKLRKFMYSGYILNNVFMLSMLTMQIFYYIYFLNPSPVGFSPAQQIIGTISSATGYMIFFIILYVLNAIYFNKRFHLFVNKKTTQLKNIYTDTKDITS